MRCGHEWHASLETWGGVLSELFNNQTRRRRERAIIIGCWGSNGGDGTGVLIVSVIGVVHGDVVVGPPVFHGVFPLAINAKQQEFRNGLSWDECILVSHGSIRSLLSTMFARSTSHGGRRRPFRGRLSSLSSLIGSSLHMDRVNDVEELLHHGHLLVHEVNRAVHGLVRPSR